jgi:hypothetical protein
MTALDPVRLAFTDGLLAAGYLLAALFFLRFWRRTRDGLFFCFAIAFALMAINQALPVLLGVGEDKAAIYLFRLAAFLMIIFAICYKNLAGRSQDQDPSR